MKLEPFPKRANMRIRAKLLIEKSERVGNEGERKNVKGKNVKGKFVNRKVRD